VDGSPVVCGEHVVVGSGDGRLYVLALGDGAEVWSYDAGQPIRSSPAVVGGMVIAGTDGGTLFALGPEE
jgi:outer membrane protein assembly factor BamB